MISLESQRPTDLKKLSRSYFSKQICTLETSSSMSTAGCYVVMFKLVGGRFQSNGNSHQPLVLKHHHLSLNFLPDAVKYCRNYQWKRKRHDIKGE